jgi:hypothetical protein
MKRIFAIAAVVLLVIVFVGCAARINKAMDSWTGHNYNELIASWGPPSQVLDDGSGGKIMVWTENRSYTSQGQATTRTDPSGTSHTTYSPPQTRQWNASRMFWVNSNGVIYKWSWRGL